MSEEEKSNSEQAIKALRITAELLQIGLFPGGVAQEVYRCKLFLLQLAQDQEDAMGGTDAQGSV